MMKLSQQQWCDICESVLDIHTSSDLLAMRKISLEKLGNLIPHEKSFFDLCCVKNMQKHYFDPVSNNMTPEEIEPYYKKYQFSDYIAWMFEGDYSLVYRDSEMVSKEVRENSNIYINWMKPMELYYSMGCSIVENNILYGSITLFRSIQSGDFTEEEMEIMRLITHHLERQFFMRYPNGIPINQQGKENILANHYLLTKRESEVTELILLGATNQNIADKLCISKNTVKKHINNLYKKFNVSSRTQLANAIFTWAENNKVTIDLLNMQ